MYEVRLGKHYMWLGEKTRTSWSLISHHTFSYTSSLSLSFLFFFLSSPAYVQPVTYFAFTSSRSYCDYFLFLFQSQCFAWHHSARPSWNTDNEQVKAQRAVWKGVISFMGMTHECHHDGSCHEAPERYANLSHRTQSCSLSSYRFESCCEIHRGGAKVKSMFEKVLALW